MRNETARRRWAAFFQERNGQAMAERLDKFVASQGNMTRKEAGRLIRAGAVTVNGEQRKDPAGKVDPAGDEVRVEGRRLTYQKHVTLMMNKPAGVLSATEDKRCPTVLDLLPPEYGRRGLFPAGRLDKDTTGLLLLTDDGDLAHRMLAPKSHVYKLYRARTAQPVTQEDIEAFREGVRFGEIQYAPARLEVEEGDSRCALVEIREGKFHQVKRMFEARGNKVVALERLRIGSLELDPALAPGQVRPVGEEELKLLFLPASTKATKF